MKNSVMLYLVILFILTNIFTYAFLNSQVKFEQNQSDQVNKKFNDTVLALTNNLDDADYFSLSKNQNAQDYFVNEKNGTYLAAEKIIPFVTEKLKEQSATEMGSKILGQEPINGKKFIINRVKILNHRWIITDFNNGDIWGEAIIKYFINTDGTVTFENNQSLIYPKAN